MAGGRLSGTLEDHYRRNELELVRRLVRRGDIRESTNNDCVDPSPLPPIYLSLDERGAVHPIYLLTAKKSPHIFSSKTCKPGRYSILRYQVPFFFSQVAGSASK